MLDRSRKFKVGLFVLGSGGLFLALLFLAIGTSFARDSVRYTIQFDETVKGMVIGSSVNFQGVQIGAVTDMRFVNGRTEVVVETDPKRAPITQHCRASLDRAWVTGQVTVELSGWEKGADILPRGALIQAQLSPMSSLAKTLPGILESLTGTLDEYRKVAENINGLLGGENAQAIAQLLQNATDLVGTLQEGSGPLLARLDGETLPRVNRLLDSFLAMEPELSAMLASLQGFSSSLDELGREPALREAIARAPELLRAAQGASVSLGRSSDALRHLLRGQGPGLSATISSLEKTLRELGTLARVLRSTPSALVFGESAPEREGQRPAAPGRRE